MTRFIIGSFYFPPSHRFYSPGLEVCCGRVIDFKKVHPGELRRQPPPQRVITGAQDKDLGSSVIYAVSNLAFTKRLSVCKGLKLTRQHPVKSFVNGNQYFSTFPFLFDGINRIRNAMLRPAQPDLINPVRCLTRLNADRVISGVLQ